MKYKVTLYVDVYDTQAAMKAARDDAEKNGCKRGIVRNSADAAQWLIDNIPPEARPGISVDECEVELVKSP